MSGTPIKRVHEDSGVGHSSISRYPHPQDEPATYPPMVGPNSKPSNPSATTDYHAVSYDLGHDTRAPKVPRTELDSRRSPLLQMYRGQPSSLNDSQSDHAVNTDNRVELRDSRENYIVKDLKVESRDVKVEPKDVRHIRGDDHKDTKYERDTYMEDKEWRFADATIRKMDPWHTSRESLNMEEKNSINEARETVSENKVDLKRKDAKDKEERGSEKWEKDRKDKLKDHHPKILEQHEKEDVDLVSSKDLGKQKSIDNWKDVDKESKERRVEKDSDMDGGADMEGGDDVEGSADKEREGFSYGVQQRKRMLRPRGSPQVANRDQRFRSRPQDNDGSTGKGDVSTVVYRVGECMQELLNLWKEYKSSNNTSTDKMSENAKSFPTLEIRIPAEHITATNRQVKGGQLWGTDIYTHDSDLVAVLMHTGYCRPTASPPPPAIQELKATVRVLPLQDCYVSTLRNNVRSRAWGAAIGYGCSFRVEKGHIVKKAGGTIDLEPCLTHTSTVEPTLAPVVVERTMTTRAAASNALRQQRFVREVTLQYNLCNEPWIKYSISAIADKGLKKPLFTSARLKKGEVLYLESPTRRYELCFNGEKIVKAAGNETDTNGVEIDNTTITNNSNINTMDIFRWSECKKPLPQTVMRSIGIPLPPEHLKVLEENLDWEDIQWSQTGVWISGKEYPLSRVHFLSPV